MARSKKKVGGRKCPPTCWVADGARTRDFQDHNLMGEYAGGYAFCAVDRRWLCTVFTSNAALQRTFSTDNRRCSSVATGFHMTRSRSFRTRGRAAAGDLAVTTILTTTLTTVARPTTPTTVGKRSYRAWSGTVPGPGSVGSKEARNPKWPGLSGRQAGSFGNKFGNGIRGTKLIPVGGGAGCR